MIKNDFRKKRFFVCTFIVILIVSFAFPIYSMFSGEKSESEEYISTTNQELSFKNMAEEENEGDDVLPKTSVFTTSLVLCGTMLMIGSIALFIYKGKHPLESFSMRNKLCL